MMRNRFLPWIAIAALSLALVAPLRASPTLYVNGVAVTPTSTGANGTLNYFTSSIPGWNVLLTTGLFMGPSGLPSMQFSFMVSGTGTLSLAFSVNDLGPSFFTDATATMGGTVGNGAANSVSMNTLVSSSNILNSGASLFAGSQLFSSGSFNSTETGTIHLPASYALTQLVTINHENATSSSGSYLLQTLSVPEGGNAIGLLAIAAAAILLAHRRWNASSGRV